MKHHRVCQFIFAISIALAFQFASAELITVAPEHEERYHELLSELRCLVCQNQTIEESNSELATDLRLEVNKMLMQGATDQEIIDFMADRYGDFVLYRPLVQPKTYLLWFGPFVFLAIVLLLVLIFLKKHKPTSSAQLSDDEKQKLDSILKQTKK